MWTKVFLNRECPGLPWDWGTLSLCLPAPLSQSQSHEDSSAFLRERLTLTHHDTSCVFSHTSENSALNTADYASEGQGKQWTFGVQMLQKSSKTLSKRRGEKEGPGQPPTDAGCDQVCNKKKKKNSGLTQS